MDTMLRLKELWRSSHLDVCPPASQEAIATFEATHQIVLPDDVRGFYEHFNGTEEMESSLNRYWPLEEIERLPKKLAESGYDEFSGIEEWLPHADDYFAFADHSIWVRVYAIRLVGASAGNRPVLWIDDRKTFGIIANSFEEYWRRYLNKPDAMI